MVLLSLLGGWRVIFGFRRHGGFPRLVENSYQRRGLAGRIPKGLLGLAFAGRLGIVPLIRPSTSRNATQDSVAVLRPLSRAVMRRIFLLASLHPFFPGRKQHKKTLLRDSSSGLALWETLIHQTRAVYTIKTLSGALAAKRQEPRVNAVSPGECN